MKKLNSKIWSMGMKNYMPTMYSNNGIARINAAQCPTIKKNELSVRCLLQIT